GPEHSASAGFDSAGFASAGFASAGFDSASFARQDPQRAGTRPIVEAVERAQGILTERPAERLAHHLIDAGRAGRRARVPVEIVREAETPVLERERVEPAGQ